MRELKQILVGVLVAAALAMGGAIIDVQVLKADVNSLYVIMSEIKEEVKEGRKDLAEIKAVLKGDK